MIDFYLDKGTFLDKAGAYGIQSEECFFVESIQGSFSNVVGFPIELFRSKNGAMAARLILLLLFLWSSNSLDLKQLKK